jgi:CBS domain-containing protein
VLLSALRRFRVADASGQSAPLTDVAIDLLADHHPPVTHIRFGPGGGMRGVRALPWAQVLSIDWEARRFLTKDLGAGAEILDASQPAAEVGDVLLGRDILDSLLLDLPNRRAARANDLVLEWREPGAAPRLVAADLSFMAMLRRLTRGRFGTRLIQQKLADWKYIEFLRGDPAAVHAGASYHRRIVRLPAGEIARLVDALPYLHAAELLTLLPDKLAADTLEAMSIQRQLQVFEELPPGQQRELLGRMAPDLAVDLLRRLHTQAAQGLLEALPPPRAARVIELLRYPEDVVGGIMTNDVLMVPISLNAGEAREKLRERLLEPDFILFVYVVDDETSLRLRGVISLRALVSAPDSARMGDLMNPYLMTLYALDGAREAAYRVLNSQLVALPVVGKDGRLLGAVTIDEAMGLVGPAAWGTTEVRVFS